DPPHVLRAAAELHHAHRLRDHVAGPRPKNVHRQQPVRLRVGDHLHQPLGLVHAPRPRAGAEGEAADAVLAAGRFDLLLRRPDAGDLRPGVDDAGHRIVVDVRLLPGQALGKGDAVLLGLVRQHGAVDQVADGVHARHVGLEVLIDVYLAGLLVDDGAGFLQAQAGDVGPTADGDEHLVAAELQVLALAGAVDDDFAALGAGAGDLRVEVE